MKRTLRLLWLLLLAVPAALPAQTPIGGDILVSHARQFQFDPHVAVGARGDFVVSWLRETSRGSPLYARRYTASGAPASGEIPVAGTALSSGVAIARDGSFAVAFLYGGPAVLSLGARWYGPNGAFRGSTVVASPVVGTDMAVASRGDGGFAVIYRTAAGVAVRAFGPDRAPLGPQTAIGPTFNLAFSPVTLAVDSDGEMTAAWQEAIQSSPQEFQSHVRARRLAADGTPLAASFLVVPEEVVLRAIHTGADRDGNLLFLWTEDGQAGLFARPFTADGAPLGAATKAMDAAPESGFDAVVDADSDAGFAAVWNESEATGVVTHIYVRRFSADGLPLGPVSRADDHGAPLQLEPAVGAGLGGIFVVAWVSGRSLVPDLFVRRFRR